MDADRGTHESPCEYECDPLTKQCFDLCDLQMYDPSVELNKDQFDMECTKRFAKRSAAAWTLDETGYPLKPIE